MNGRQLRVARERRGVSGYQIAERMAVSRQRITLLEQQSAPEPATIIRYLTAVLLAAAGAPRENAPVDFCPKCGDDVTDLVEHVRVSHVDATGIASDSDGRSREFLYLMAVPQVTERTWFVLFLDWPTEVVRMRPDLHTIRWAQPHRVQKGVPE